MSKETVKKCATPFARHNLSKLNQVQVHPDGRTTVSSQQLSGQEQDTEALIYQTNSGYKLISLAPECMTLMIQSLQSGKENHTLSSRKY